MDKIIEQSSMAGDQWSDVSDKTLAESGFYWREKNGVKVLVCRPLEDAGFTNGFSTRLGGVSNLKESEAESEPGAIATGFFHGDLNLAGFDEDTAANIYENRRRFLGTFDGDYKLATSWQVHGDDVKVITNDNLADSEARFDALTSNLEGILVGVKTADCVPILIGDPVRKAYAAVHAGWRGTVESIVVKTVAQMQNQFGSRTLDLVVAIGPHATRRSYEIGNDVIEQFQACFPECDYYFEPTRDGHARIDLSMANEEQLLRLNVRPRNIKVAPFCTMERPDLFFSYRLEKSRYGKTGRLMSVIGRKK